MVYELTEVSNSQLKLNAQFEHCQLLAQTQAATSSFNVQYERLITDRSMDCEICEAEQ